MALRIEDYALIGDTQAVGLVGRDGSLDWLCLPRFDSGACFAALLGTPEHGRWLIAPVNGDAVQSRRRYREGTLVLETTFTTPEGTVRLVDCMPPRGRTPDVVRLVEGVEGRVPMRMELVLRFDSGSVVPWVRKRPGGGLLAVAGPDAVTLDTPVATRGEGLTTVADFTVAKGERVPFVLTWFPSHEEPPPRLDAAREVEDTTAWWREWSARCTYQGEWRDAVLSSLMVLKALTYAPTGGIVAAATTSLPEWPGGVRNWDYRYCWLRDATFTLQALLHAGYREEAAAWRDWLLRSVAGDPSKLQIMYGVAGERRLTEAEAPWLPGYEGSAPVRLGNAAVHQLQLDVPGEVMDALHQTRRGGLAPEDVAWSMQRALLRFLEGNWERPDEGLWEVRGPRQHFTFSKVMAWVAFDRALKGVASFGLDGPVARWRHLCDRIHAEVCARAWDGHRRAFTQAYGSRKLDASLLLMPQVGFLPVTDPRMRDTVAAIERDLLRDGFVRRYATDSEDSGDGLPGGEGAFLACSFWLADCYVLMGREADARALFERLLAVRNDVGLLSEEYDPVGRRLLGNVPQAFSHVGLINTALNLTPGQPTPALERPSEPTGPSCR
ncbi:glycoside hydrolase family 15 protein [Corallococcus sp. AS-1-6]|uniref:glycoside hydrolase family 15 protein n=1 Tax=Corallococcus sp. AS-1-6 TaxID=2874599 RepID=UPI001CC1139A|nr:glycoside hydrolase family 15 protein [Corallococcus sp. AS-1-6]MBZ4374622.1 glycoside hydrolase family 15 protein [Corallococcus sp. AS-1-6]